MFPKIPPRLKLHDMIRRGEFKGDGDSSPPPTRGRGGHDDDFASNEDSSPQPKSAKGPPKMFREPMTVEELFNRRSSALGTFKRQTAAGMNELRATGTTDFVPEANGWKGSSLSRTPPHWPRGSLPPQYGGGNSFYPASGVLYGGRNYYPGYHPGGRAAATAPGSWYPYPPECTGDALTNEAQQALCAAAAYCYWGGSALGTGWMWDHDGQWDHVLCRDHDGQWEDDGQWGGGESGFAYDELSGTWVEAGPPEGGGEEAAADPLFILPPASSEESAHDSDRSARHPQNRKSVAPPPGLEEVGPPPGLERIREDDSLFASTTEANAPWYVGGPPEDHHRHPAHLLEGAELEPRSLLMPRSLVDKYRSFGAATAPPEQIEKIDRARAMAIDRARATATWLQEPAALGPMVSGIDETNARVRGWKTAGAQRAKVGGESWVKGTKGDKEVWEGAASDDFSWDSMTAKTQQFEKDRQRHQHSVTEQRAQHQESAAATSEPQEVPQLSSEPPEPSAGITFDKNELLRLGANLAAVSSNGRGIFSLGETGETKSQLLASGATATPWGTRMATDAASESSLWPLPLRLSYPVDGKGNAPSVPTQETTAEDEAAIKALMKAMSEFHDDQGLFPPDDDEQIPTAWSSSSGGNVAPAVPDDDGTRPVDGGAVVTPGVDHEQEHQPRPSAVPPGVDHEQEHQPGVDALARGLRPSAASDADSFVSATGASDADSFVSAGRIHHEAEDDKNTVSDDRRK